MHATRWMGILSVGMLVIAGGCRADRSEPEAATPAAADAATGSNAEAGQAQPLFDGASFDGWDEPGTAFRIEDGAIVAGTLEAEIPRNEFLCTTEAYDDFELTLQARLLGDGANAGVQFRTERIPDHHEVIGYQADLGDGWWGKLYDESRRNRVLAEPDSSALDGRVNDEDWNDYRIRAEGDRIQLFFNGVPTVDFTETDPDVPRTGLICVQIHSGPPSEAWYRDLMIHPLP